MNKQVKAKGERLEVRGEVAVMPNRKMIPQERCSRDVVKVLIFSVNEQLLEKVEEIIYRDFYTHLRMCNRAQNMLCAQIYGLELFNASESMAFYHYHLQRTVGNRANVWVATQRIYQKGGQR